MIFKNLVLQALGTIWFRFLQKKSKKKISCLCTFNAYIVETKSKLTKCWALNIPLKFSLVRNFGKRKLYGRVENSLNCLQNENEFKTMTSKKRKQDACLERSCTKRKYNIWRSLLCWKMLLKQGSGKRKQDVCLDRSCTGESTISGGLYFAERCCWKKLCKEKVQYLEVSTLLKDVVKAGFWKEKAEYLSWQMLRKTKVEYFDVSGRIFKKCSRNFIMKIESPLRRKSSVKNVLQRESKILWCVFFTQGWCEEESEFLGVSGIIW
jgi:hypothetical protein